MYVRCMIFYALTDLLIQADRLIILFLIISFLFFNYSTHFDSDTFVPYELYLFPPSDVYN